MTVRLFRSFSTLSVCIATGCRFNAEVDLSPSLIQQEQRTYTPTEFIRQFLRPSVEEPKPLLGRWGYHYDRVKAHQVYYE